MRTKREQWDAPYVGEDVVNAPSHPYDYPSGYHCPDCGRWHTPLRPICPSCWSGRVGPQPVAGTGTVYAITLLHQGPPPVAYSPPWPLAAVEPVTLTWIERDGAPWPAFRAVAP